MEKYGKLTIIGLDHQKTYSNGYAQAQMRLF